MKVDIESGKLNQRITFLRRITDPDDIGCEAMNVDEVSLEPYHNCWASVRGVAGHEYWEAREQHEESTRQFKVRYCQKLADIDKINYFIGYDGKIYDITDINNLYGADSLLIIRAIERT